MAKIEPVDRMAVLSTPVKKDPDGYAAVANLCTGGSLVHLSVNTPDGAKGFPCTRVDAAVFAEHNGPVENLYAGPSGRITVTDAASNLRSIAASLRPGAEHPGAFWLLMEPRAETAGRPDVRAAVLYAIRKPAGLFRYVLYAHMTPCAVSDGLFHVSVAARHIYDGSGSETPMSGGVRVGQPNLAYKFIRSMWHLEVARQSVTEKPLPGDPPMPTPECILGSSPKARAEYEKAYRFTGSQEWAAARTARDQDNNKYSVLDPSFLDLECAVWHLDPADPLGWGD